MKNLVTRFRILLALSSAATLLVCQHRADSQEIQFNRDVRPILSQKCFVCHGTDGNRREADLRLDQQEGIRAAFEPQLENSKAWKRIISGDPDEQMPPTDSGLTLSSAEKETLRRWIVKGAKWEGHWAFIAPKRPPLPPNNEQRAQHAIDRFILATLQAEGSNRSAKPIVRLLFVGSLWTLWACRHRSSRWRRSSLMLRQMPTKKW